MSPERHRLAPLLPRPEREESWADDHAGRYHEGGSPVLELIEAERQERVMNRESGSSSR